MQLSLFDLHCDTAYEMHRTNQSLKQNDLMISLENARKFKQYVQVMALWTDHVLTDEDGWQACLAMYQRLRMDPAIQGGDALLCTKPSANDALVPQILLGVEDLRILNGIENRLDTLWEMGVRWITPLWKGESCIGGSHDTSMGLTEFGKTAVKNACNRGMIVDISHASERSSEDILSIAKASDVPIVATHSNAYALCPVTRNLRLWQINAIVEQNGVIGLNLYPDFICSDREASIDDLIPHIEYFLSYGLEDRLCLGCDMDGATMPKEIQNLAALPVLAERLQRLNYTDTLIDKLFFANAFRFASQYLK